jgi:hypothetical protein
LMLPEHSPFRSKTAAWNGRLEISCEDKLYYYNCIIVIIVVRIIIFFLSHYNNYLIIILLYSYAKFLLWSQKLW